MRVLPRTLALAAALLALLAQGCADAGAPAATAPSAAVPREGSALSMAHAGSLDPLARFHHRPALTIAWARTWIGPEGGRLDFMGFSIEVPPGAVRRRTQFSIRLPVDPNGAERVMAEFGPHGTRFARPVRIGFPLRGTSIEGSADPSVVWWNGGWVDMGGRVSADGRRLETWTDHFSEYGTTDSARFGHTISTSGG